MKVYELLTEAKKWGVKHTGQNTNKTIAQLRKELAAAKKRGDTKTIKQKEFAIRAKKRKGKWGKVSEGTVGPAGKGGARGRALSTDKSVHTGFSDSKAPGNSAPGLNRKKDGKIKFTKKGRAIKGPVRKAGRVAEEWDHEAHINPAKRGMWDGWTVPELESYLNEIKSKGPHPEGSKDAVLQHELEFAIRAKTGWGKVGEAWEKEVHITPEKRDMFAGKTLTQLKHELNALLKAGPHPEDSPGYTKMKELQFAIRAKKAKGKKWKGVSTDGFPIKSGHMSHNDYDEQEEGQTGCTMAGETDITA